MNLLTFLSAGEYSETTYTLDGKFHPTLAETRNITVIELPKYQDNRPLTAVESNQLAKTVLDKLGKKPA